VSTPSIPSDLTAGRTRQKLRTRDALIAAARELITQGASPTVEDAAVAASISRTTAYRYFPNQAALLAAAHPETKAQSLLPSDASADPAERLRAVVEKFTQILLDSEPQQRTMLRLSLEPRSSPAPLLLRQGRAIAWIAEALAPLKGTLSKAEVHRLVLAVCATTGIEAFVWLTDVAGLTRVEATKLMRWSAAALFRSAVEGRTAARPRKPRA
jgi:AcrR family transcriptional regulator